MAAALVVGDAVCYLFLHRTKLSGATKYLRMPRLLLKQRVKIQINQVEEYK